MGEEGAQFFRQSFELKIKGDMIPESAVESITGELQDLFARHGAGAALSAKAVFKPTKDFHTARHTLFSAEQNLEIDEVVPVSVSVKTKLGRGGAGVTRTERDSDQNGPIRDGWSAFVLPRHSLGANSEEESRILCFLVKSGLPSFCCSPCLRFSQDWLGSTGLFLIIRL